MIADFYRLLFSILSSLLTPIIALIAVYIAYQQFVINKRTYEISSRKLKLDLYNKRFRVFNETKQVLLKIVQDAKIDLIELRNFIFSVNESAFLFEKEITDYLELIRKNAIEYNHALDDIEKHPIGSDEKLRIIESNRKLADWFLSVYQSIESRFQKYLDFRDL